MKSPSKSQVAIRAMVVGVLLTGLSVSGGAQKPQKPPQGPPVTTKGAVKAAPQAEKGQATAESKRVEARERMAEHNEVKFDESARKRAFKEARKEPDALLRGIKLSKEERKQYKAVEKQHAKDVEQLEEQAKEAEKAGKPDPSVEAKLDDLRRRERSELRATLPPQAQAQFDKNASAYGRKKN